jgi:peptidoglycan/LPS O-acetylase OafA/YrhL
MIQALLTHFGVLHIEPWEFLTAMTYTVNSVVGVQWNLGHLWSLSVEEQFYLLWPAALSLAGLKGGARLALGAVLLAPLLRSLNYFQHSPVNNRIFPLLADFLAIGCVLALTRDRLHKNAIYRKLLSSRWFFLVPTAAYLMRIYPRGRTLAFLLSLGNVCLALTVDWTIVHSEGPVGRFLNAKPLVYIGTLSYSLYLWQQFFVNRSGTLEVNAFPWNFLATLAAGALSYHLVERPFLRLKGRLHSNPNAADRALVCAA